MMPNTTTVQLDWHERLRNILRQQKTLLLRLAELAREQGAFIRENKTDDLLGLLGERQQIIDRFLALQHDMGDLSDGLEDRLDELAPDCRNEIRELIRTIGEQLDEVMQHDERDRHELQSSRDETKKELSEMGNAGRARRAYLGATGNNTRFADRQG